MHDADTIEAVSSAPGRGRRAIVRVCGPSAFAVAARLAEDLPRPLVRGVHPVDVRIAVADDGGGRDRLSFAALVLVLPGPGSYTGEDTVEWHVPGSPLLVAALRAELARHGVRPATPGEFTRRAFENGRLDLAAAEAVGALIRAEDDDDLRHAQRLASGAFAASAAQLCDRIDAAIAALEVELDFDEVEVAEGGAPDERPLGRRALDDALAAAEEFVAGVPSIGAIAADVVLVGAANAGKSSLLNALAERDVALVSDVAGTTRDLVAAALSSGVRVFDAPGDLAVPDTAADGATLSARDAWLASSDAARVLVLPAEEHAIDDEEFAAEVVRYDARAVVHTKADLVATTFRPPPAPSGIPSFVVSNVTGEGIAAFRAWLDRRPRRGADVAVAHLAAAARAARAGIAEACAQFSAGVPSELVVVELRRARGEVAGFRPGARVDEAVLDRVFAGFCLGK